MDSESSRSGKIRRGKEGIRSRMEMDRVCERKTKLIIHK